MTVYVLFVRLFVYYGKAASKQPINSSKHLLPPC